MNKLIDKLNNALIELDRYVLKYEYSKEEWPYKGTEKFLTLLKNAGLEGKEIDINLLRAMVDIYVVSFRNYEDTDLHKAIQEVYYELEKKYPYIKGLSPLGMDFGKYIK